MGDSTSSLHRRSRRSGAGNHRKRAATVAEEARPDIEILNTAKKPRRHPPVDNIRPSSPHPESPLFEEQALLEEPHELEYRGSWRALVNRRLELSGGQIGKWPRSYLSKELLDTWQTESDIAYQGKLKLSYQYTEAIVTHEKCRAQDQLKCDIKDGDNLESVYGLLQEILDQGHQPILRLTCHFNGVYAPDAVQFASQAASQNTVTLNPERTSRQSTTQMQRNGPGEFLEPESITRNPGPMIAEKWLCASSRCKNQGRFCWVYDSPDCDNPRNHYPVSEDMMRRWSQDVMESNATIDTPPSWLVLEFAEEKEEKRIRAKALRESKKEAGSSTEKLLQQVLMCLMVTMWCQQQQQQQQQLQAFAQASSSSPVARSNVDSAEVLRQFFEWYIKHYAAQQKETFTEIYMKLVDEDWCLDDIRTESKGGAMRPEVWERYGFKLGTLAKIQGKISAFKRYRGI
jgi:hypothetical protein